MRRNIVGFPIVVLLLGTGCAVKPLLLDPSSSLLDIKRTNTVQMDEDASRVSRALHYYLVGQMSFAKDDYKTALQSFTKASQLIDIPAPALHAKLAQLRLKEGNLIKAEEEAKKAIEQDPESEPILLLYAGILESMQRFEEAIPLYERIIVSNPQRMESHLLLAGMYLNNRRTSDALRTLNNFLTRFPDSNVGFYYLGRAHEQRGDERKALQLIQKAYNLDQSNIPIAVDYIRVLLKAREVNRAKSVCEQVLEKDPKNVVARRVMGHLFIGESNFDSALEHLEVLEQEEEDSTETRFKIALIHLEKQNFARAEQELRLVLAKDPTHAQAYYYLASLQATTGRRKEALEAISHIKPGSEMFVKSRMLAAFLQRQEGNASGAESAIREAFAAEPGNIQLRTYLVSLLREQNRAGEAVPLLEEALQTDPKNEKLLFDYGALLDDVGRRDEAIDTMRRVISLNEKHSDALNYLAYVLAEKQEHRMEARRFIERALRTRPNDGYYLDTLGWIQFHSGETTASVETFRKAVELAGHDPVILDHLGDALLKSGDNDGAKASYEKAVEILEKASDRNDKLLRSVQEKLSSLKKL